MQSGNAAPIGGEGQLQLLAGFRLLQWSHLILWNEDNSQFTPNTHEEFTRWREQLDATFERRMQAEKTFGRLSCWIAFSVGAEYFAKGACLWRHIDIRKTENGTMIQRPSADDNISSWALRWAGKVAKSTRVVYRTMGSMVYGPNYLKQLASHPNVKLSVDERAMLIAGYRLLAAEIRNRDAHLYVRDVREDDFPLVQRVFVPCLNTLVKCIPGGSKALAKMLIQ